MIASTSSARAIETFPAEVKGNLQESQNMRDGPGWRDAIPALWTKVASYGLPARRIRDLQSVDWVGSIGRKLITYGWHILRGDPTPNRDGEAFFDPGQADLRRSA